MQRLSKKAGRPFLIWRNVCCGKYPLARIPPLARLRGLRFVRGSFPAETASHTLRRSSSSSKIY
ncbi:MAG TPA: hypothetical protein VLA21_00270, partial [Candidatus Limnocylindria bacterium]|nr:hypothetical protein [Candidatus Limnocylindria bacterium]